MGTIPFSNPGGNNQTNPVNSLLPKANPVQSGGSTVAGGNPYMPPAPGNIHPQPIPGGSPTFGGTPVPMGSTGTTAPTVPNVGGLTTTGKNVAGDTGALEKQLIDIYGKGTGGALAKLLEGMSGTDSKILQEYIASLQPQLAKASAGVGAALGAGGVSGNSSVNAIAQSNLQSQETAAIASESANLTMSQEELTAKLLMGISDKSAKEVATSGWSIFGDVMNQITGDIGNLLGGSFKTPGNSSSSSGGFSPSQLPFGSDISMGSGAADIPIGGPSNTLAGLDMSAFI